MTRARNDWIFAAFLAVGVACVVFGESLGVVALGSHLASIELALWASFAWHRRDARRRWDRVLRAGGAHGN